MVSFIHTHYTVNKPRCVCTPRAYGSFPVCVYVCVGLSVCFFKPIYLLYCCISIAAKYLYIEFRLVDLTQQRLYCHCQGPVLLYSKTFPNDPEIGQRVYLPTSQHGHHQSMGLTKLTPPRSNISSKPL